MKVETTKLAYIGTKPGTKKNKSRDSDAWFTPPVYIDSVRSVMGRIDLDPFSSIRANEVVGANNFFTKDNCAFENEWKVGKHVKVFMNPPYSSGMCSRAVNRFIDQYEAKNFVEGIVLVNNATDTRWFSSLIHHCDGICFTNHRISFWNSDGKNISGNTRGQAFFYFGKRIKNFNLAFEKHGFVLIPFK